MTTAPAGSTPPADADADGEPASAVQEARAGSVDQPARTRTGRRLPTWQRVDRATPRLATQAVQRMAELPWFEALPAAQRADVGLVVQTGLGAFLDWLRDPAGAPAPAPEVFSVAPRELARSVSLKQTVQLIRVVVGVVEEQVPALAAPGEQARLAEQVLKYSREIAFAAAEVYAAAAEARGAWDARVESGVVEALVRGQVGELTLNRAASLGWSDGQWVTAVAAASPGHGIESAVTELRAHARHRGWSVLTGEAGGGLLVVVSGRGHVDEALGELADALPAGPVVLGPTATDLASAAASVGEALAGLAAVAGWPDAPRPVASSALLVERVVVGDERARTRLLEEVHRPLAAAGGDLLRTAAAFLEGGGSVEGAGRALFLHPNTVRYRLRKIVDTIGCDLTTPRDAQLVRLALVLGRVRTPAPAAL
ncbi:MAG: helix-turn-helix domain-containing protein [Actinomycetota bacterium]|nr:helix-turn-helix domain-containing protein [Actinomycetota bacterium]